MQVATRHSGADVVLDHGLDAALAVGRMHEVVPELGRGDLGYVLVLGDGEHLVLAQLAQGETVLQCQHRIVARPVKFGHSRDTGPPRY